MNEGVEAAALGLRFLLAFLFLATAIPKLVARDAFVRVVASYRLLPRRLVVPAAGMVARIELAVALVLGVGIATRAAAGAAVLLLLAFASAIAINLRRGRVVECGCLGAASEPISWFLFVRDLALAGAAAFCAITVPPSLAIDSLWSAHSPVSESDAGALAIVGVGVAVAELLVMEAIRTTRAARTHQQRTLV